MRFRPPALERRTLGRVLGLAVIVGALGGAAVAGAEAYYRLGRPCFVSALAWDRAVGWKLRPGVISNVTYPWSTEPIELRVNREGFRDREHPRGKAAGVRIMVVGDSYTAGLEVAEEDIFTHRLQEAFDASDPVGRGVEVMNLGVGAWSTDQQLIELREDVSAYEPDVVLLMIAPNDVREAYAKGFFRVVDGELVEQPERRIPLHDRFGWWLANHSCAFQALQRRIGSGFGTARHMFRFYPPHFPVGDGGSADEHLFLREPPPELAPAFELFDALVLGIRDLCAEAGCELVLSVMPTKIELDGTLDPELHRPGRIGSHVASLGRRHGIAYVDLFERLVATRADPLEMFIEQEYHLTPRGHAFVAAALLEALGAR